MSRIAYGAAVVASHAESWFRRMDAWTPRPRANGQRRCVLCGGPMHPDTRPPRVIRFPDGETRDVPEDVLTWLRCGTCGKSQTGERP